MQKTPTSNNPTQDRNNPALKRVRKNVYKQALLAGFLIVLTVVILFAVTAAWYTNVVRTAGLVFEAATWGFEGTVELAEGSIQASPGDEGVIALTAASKSDAATAVSVNISKKEMEPVQMRQRIYFYVDTQKTRNGEQMDRVYLNDSEYYTYTIFGNGNLTLTETVYNDAQLKWQWVYDVLGYYVRSTWVENGDGTGQMVVSEYLRPIEYDYDMAATTFDEDTGELLTVDGTTTAAQFLYELSLTDGYAGTIGTRNTDGTVTAAASIDGYYPVAVEENGTGVWAYLCNYSQIMYNNEYDTALGSGTAYEEGTVPTYVATLTLTAQNSEVNTVEVATPAALLAALESAQAGGTDAVVCLADDMVLGEDANIVLDGGQKVLLDLNGHSLQVPSGTYDGKAGGIQASPGSSLTVMDGTLTGTGGTGHVITANGAEITMSNVTIQDAETALYIRDDYAASDSLIRLVGCTIDTSEEAIYFSGNSTASARDSRLIVEDCNITSGYIGIMGNGSANRWGTDIQVIRSVVTGKYAGIYQPMAESVLTVSGSSILNGYSGLVLKGGSAYLYDSTVNGTGTTHEEPVIQGSGFSDTGDGIYVETGYGCEIILEVRNCTATHTAAGALALRVFEEDADNVSVTVYSGTFTSDVTAFCADGATCFEREGAYLVSYSETEETA